MNYALKKKKLNIDIHPSRSWEFQFSASTEASMAYDFSKCGSSYLRQLFEKTAD